MRPEDDEDFVDVEENEGDDDEEEEDIEEAEAVVRAQTEQKEASASSPPLAGQGKRKAEASGTTSRQVSQRKHYPTSAEKELERLLPIDCISRIMKKVLPSDAVIHKEALLDIQKCLSQLIACITTESGLHSIQQNGTRDCLVTGEDVLATMDGLGMEQWSTLVRQYLKQFREVGVSTAAASS